MAAAFPIGHDLVSQDVANMAWTFAKLMVNDHVDVLVDAFLAVKQFKLQELSNIAWGFSTLAVSSAPAWHVLAEASVQEIHTGDPSLADLESLVAATAVERGDCSFEALYPGILLISSFFLLQLRSGPLNACEHNKSIQKWWHEIAAQTLEERARSLDAQHPSPVRLGAPGETPAVLARGDGDLGDLYVLWKPPGWRVDVGRDDFQGIAEGRDSTGSSAASWRWCPVPHSISSRDGMKSEDSDLELSAWLVKELGDWEQHGHCLVPRAPQLITLPLREIAGGGPGSPRIEVADDGVGRASELLPPVPGCASTPAPCTWRRPWPQQRRGRRTCEPRRPRPVDAAARAAQRKLQGERGAAAAGDGGGNKKLADVGPWLRDKIVERVKQAACVKYIDPTYMIRAIKPNANDSATGSGIEPLDRVYCSMLSHNAVHAAMAGYTAITVGQINCRYVMLPIACVTKNPQPLGRDPLGFILVMARQEEGGFAQPEGMPAGRPQRRFQELVSTTLQPDFTPDGVEAKENPLLTVSEPVRRLECEHLSLTFGERDFTTTLIEQAPKNGSQVKGGEVSFFDQTSWVSLRVMMLYAYGVKKVYGIKGGEDVEEERAEALNAIETAYVEATCNANCIGLVKLMGRHCGYLTMMSVLAARKVDICLLPEMDINLDKVLDHCVELVSTSGCAVVVIAEGCGDTLMNGTGCCGHESLRETKEITPRHYVVQNVQTGGTDEGGNKKISDVGPWLKALRVRAVPANPNDSIYCSELAQAAVHAAMAGYTGLTVGKVDQHVVYLPIKLLVSMPSRIVDVNGRWFEALRTTTQQPNLEFTGAANAKPLDPTKQSLRRSIFKRHNSGQLEKADTLRVPQTTLQIMDGYGQEGERRALARDDLIQDAAVGAGVSHDLTYASYISKADL
eukprot:Skav229725  [mRNA]  locus=scaffold49:378036:398494:- [translate_table: standard]